MMNWKLACLGLAVLSAALQPVRAESLEAPKMYRSLPSGMSIALDSENSRIVLDGHSVLPAQVCPPRSPYRCIHGGGAVFAFPKKRVAVGDTWTLEEKHFRVARQLPVRVLGRVLRAYHIEQTGTPEPSWYLYSEHAGLLAFGGVGSAQGGYLLENVCGFAASPACAKSK